VYFPYHHQTEEEQGASGESVAEHLENRGEQMRHIVTEDKISHDAQDRHEKHGVQYDTLHDGIDHVSAARVLLHPSFANLQ